MQIIESEQNVTFSEEKWALTNPPFDLILVIVTMRLDSSTCLTILSFD